MMAQKQEFKAMAFRTLDGPTLAMGAPPVLPPSTRPVKVGGPSTPRIVTAPKSTSVLDAELSRVAGELDAALKADIDRLVRDLEARGLVALADVWGKGRQYVRGNAALWGVS